MRKLIILAVAAAALTTAACNTVSGIGRDLSAVQVTGEANLTAVPDAGDGAYPGAIDALARGVVAAARTKHDLGVSADIGFAVVPEPDPATGTFW